MDDLKAQVIDHEHRLRTVERDVSGLRADNEKQHGDILVELKDVKKLLQGDDSDNGICTRVKVLEVDQMHTRKMITAKDGEKAAQTRGQWGAMAALITALAALAGTTVMACSQMASQIPTP